MSDVHDHHDYTVFVDAENAPIVVKNGVTLQKLEKRSLSWECNNGWSKFHRLSASDANYFYLLTSDRSLVRYLWTDIEAGIFDKDTTVKTKAADFTS